MALCPPCEALQGKPADIDPHDDLRGQDHVLLGDGVRETYRCVASKAFGNQSGSWKFLSSAGR
jgi:hypothetical protein